MGNDKGSVWQDPGFVNAAACDFTLMQGGAAVSKIGIHSIEIPPVARWDYRVGGGGCRTPPHHLLPEAEPLQPTPLSATDLVDPQVR